MIKKQFQEIVSLLEANADDTVASVLEQVRSLASSKRGGSDSFYTDPETGQVLAVFDAYFKRWISPLVMPFGLKASAASGLYTMCKQGVSNYNKQKAKFAKEQIALLDKVSEGEIDPAKIPEAIELLTMERDEVLPIVEISEDTEGNEVRTPSDYQGFSTMQECLEDVKDRGLV